MEYLIHLILSNSLSTILVGGVCLVIIFFLLKKMVKLLLYAFLFLLAVLAYIYYSGGSVSTIVKPVQSAVKKVEKSVRVNKDVDEARKKVGKSEQ
jgi:predicted membrane metal-binding protein